MSTRNRKPAASKAVVPSQLNPSPPRDENSYVHQNEFEEFKLKVEAELAALKQRVSL